jgi:hypothetical protein
MSGTVTVACKTPNGILIGDGIHINGFAYERSQPPPHDIVGGYGITNGVDADIWNKWLASNAESHIVKRELIFADESPIVVRMKARSMGPPLTITETIVPGR